MRSSFVTNHFNKTILLGWQSEAIYFYVYWKLIKTIQCVLAVLSAAHSTAVTASIAVISMQMKENFNIFMIARLVY